MVVDFEEADKLEPEVYANVARGDRDKDEVTTEFEEEEDSAAMAFATMGCDCLNWKAA